MAIVPDVPAPRSDQRPHLFRALRHRNYRLWFTGQGISLIGTWMQTMAQQILVYRLTGSVVSLGMINFLPLIPLVPLALWGGSLSDRANRRTILLVTQAISLVQALILAVLTWTGAVQVWHVYVLTLLLGAVNAIDMPTRQAITVDLVEGKEDLTNAIGLNSAIFNGARALGPALAGIAVATTGEAVAFLLNAASFVAVLASLILMRDMPQRNAKMGENERVSGHMVEGVRYAFKQQSILVLISLVAVSAFLSMPYSTLMPVFASNVLNRSAMPVIQFLCEGQSPLLRCQTPEALTLGILMTAVGIGAVSGALLVAALPNSARRGRMLTIGNLSFPLLLLVFAGSNSFALSIVALVGVGICFVWQNALANTLLQLITPDHMRGRVMSLYSLMVQGMMRAGGLQASLVAGWLSAPISIGLGAALSLAYGLLVALRYPKVRDLA